MRLDIISKPNQRNKQIQVEYLQGHFAFQVASEVIDEKFLWWKPEQFLEC